MLHPTLYTLYFTLRTLHFTLQNPDSTLYTSHFTLRTAHFTLDAPHSTFYTFTPHSTRYALHTLHSTLETLHSTIPTSQPSHSIPHSTLHCLHCLHALKLHAVHPTPFHTPQSTLVREQGKNVQGCWNSLFHKKVLRGCIRVRWLLLFPVGEQPDVATFTHVSIPFYIILFLRAYISIIHIYTFVYTITYIYISILSTGEIGIVGGSSFLISHLMSKVLFLPFEGAKLLSHVVLLVIWRIPASSFYIPTVYGFKCYRLQFGHMR